MLKAPLFVTGEVVGGTRTHTNTHTHTTTHTNTHTQTHHHPHPHPHPHPHTASESDKDTQVHVLQEPPNEVLGIVSCALVNGLAFVCLGSNLLLDLVLNLLVLNIPDQHLEGTTHVQRNPL